MADRLPSIIRPMLAVPGRLPIDAHGWSLELKWDGVRGVAYLEGGHLLLRSRNDIDITRTYPEVQPLADVLGDGSAILDGELVALDAYGRPSFGRLQQRMKQTSPSAGLMSAYPVVYVVFDLLALGGRATIDLGYERRRELLEASMPGGSAWRVSPVLEGDPADVLRATAEQGLEGVVAKRHGSPYRPGVRSPDWRKVKNERTQEVVVGGWKPGRGSRERTVGSLLLGIPEVDGLRYVGKVGTGFTHAMLDDLQVTLVGRERATTPFVGITRQEAVGARWCEPELVGEVTYNDWTPERRLRQPAWRGLRPDKGPSDVRLEGETG
jgi:bifunctional non-homologous end joining protein LigD